MPGKRRLARVLFFGLVGILALANSGCPYDPQPVYELPVIGSDPAPPMVPEEGFFGFVAIGDAGRGFTVRQNAQRAIALRMKNYLDLYHYDTVLLLGDNIYPTGGNEAELKEKFEIPYNELVAGGGSASTPVWAITMWAIVRGAGFRFSA